MSNVSCPHCGTANPANAAYCARCQRPLTKAGAAPAGNLPSASQVAQQILQKRPPVPSTAQPAPLPTAAQVAASLMQRRTQEGVAPAVERTVIERAPSPPAKKAAPPPEPRPSPQQRPRGLDELTDADDFNNQPTAVFTIPKSLHDEPTRNAGTAPRFDAGATQRTPLAPAAPRPAAAPSLPQPAIQRNVVPAAREPAARAATRRAEPSSDMHERRGTGVPMLREGAVPPQHPAPQPPEKTAVGIEYAAGWRLLLSHAVDFALLSVFFVAFAKLDATLSGPKGVDTSGLFDWIGSHPGSTLRAAILTTLVGTAYHIVMAQLSGRTLGRMVAGTTLARRSGKPLNTFVIVLRAAASFASLLMFGAGFFWSIVDRRGRGFHDLVAGTMVVRYHG